MKSRAASARPPIDIPALKQGSTDAQNAFWRAHHGDVHAICCGVLGRGADAEEVADGVLSDFLFKYVHRLETPAAARSYLRLMAVRRSIRRRERRDRQSGSEPDVLADQARLTAEERANYALLLPRLGHCMEELTPKAQEVLRLRFRSELTNQKIGGLVGGSKQYIGRLIKRSLEILRGCLESSGRMEQGA